MCLRGGYTAREQPLCTACYPSNLIDFQQKFVWELMLIFAELTHFWRENYAQLLWTSQYSLPSEIYRRRELHMFIFGYAPGISSLICEFLCEEQYGISHIGLCSPTMLLTSLRFGIYLSPKHDMSFESVFCSVIPE